MDKAYKLRELSELIMDSNDIVISAHTGPDGDAVGSVAALFLFLKGLGKNVTAALEKFPSKFNKIPGATEIVNELTEATEIKMFISLDCGDKKRLGKFQDFFEKAETTVNIDHHISNDMFAEHNYVDVEASATCEIMYDLLTICNEDKIDKDIASAIYTGILSDTGGFRHSSTTSHTYYAAGKLIEMGADFSNIFKSFFYTRRMEETKILSVALQKMQSNFDGKYVWTSIVFSDLKKEKARLSDLDSIVDYCKSIEGCKIAAFYYQKGENEFKASFRSEPGYDVCEIAKKFGGGGHKNAAGSSFFSSLEEAIEESTREIKAALEREN